MAYDTLLIIRLSTISPTLYHINTLSMEKYQTINRSRVQSCRVKHCSVKGASVIIHINRSFFRISYSTSQSKRSVLPKASTIKCTQPTSERLPRRKDYHDATVTFGFIFFQRSKSTGVRSLLFCPCVHIHGTG